MKLNWGHYILISFILFVLLILYMVFRTFQTDNELISEDYYANELKFQDVIDKKQNAALLEKDISWKSIDGGLELSFPELSQAITGKIVMIRPSDQSKDISFDIELDENGIQRIKDESLIYGKYLIQIDWKSGAAEYYTEGSAFILK